MSNCREIYPDCDCKRWEVSNSIELADADNYYTKPQIDEIVDGIVISGGGITSGQVQTMIDKSVSGKVDTSTFNYYSAITNTTINGKQDKLVAGRGISISGNVISCTISGGSGGTSVVVDPQLSEYSDNPVANSAITNAIEDLEIMVNGKQDILIGGEGINISGNVISCACGSGQTITIDPTLNSGSTNPVANSAITIALNNKADKSEIPTVPTSNSAFTNDMGYITEMWLEPYATDDDLERGLSGKQDTLIAGSGITISGNVISCACSGGGGGSGQTITIDPTLDSGSTNPVANSAITAALDSKVDNTTINNYLLKNKIVCLTEQEYNNLPIIDSETLYLIHS